MIRYKPGDYVLLKFGNKFVVKVTELCKSYTSKLFATYEVQYPDGSYYIVFSTEIERLAKGEEVFIMFMEA